MVPFQYSWLHSLACVIDSVFHLFVPEIQAMVGVCLQYPLFYGLLWVCTVCKCARAVRDMSAINNPTVSEWTKGVLNGDIAFDRKSCIFDMTVNATYRSPFLVVIRLTLWHVISPTVPLTLSQRVGKAIETLLALISSFRTKCRVAVFLPSSPTFLFLLPLWQYYQYDIYLPL